MPEELPEGVVPEEEFNPWAQEIDKAHQAWEEAFNLPQTLRYAAWHYKTVTMTFSRQTGDIYPPGVVTRRVVLYSLRKSINRQPIQPVYSLLVFFFNFDLDTSRSDYQKTESCNINNITDVVINHDDDIRASGAPLYRGATDGVHEELVDQITESGGIIGAKVPIWRPASARRGPHGF
jgi:hypothetical protein